MTEKQYPELPTHFMLVQESFRDEVYLYTADQMRAYVDADRAMRAAPAAPASHERDEAINILVRLAEGLTTHNYSGACPSDESPKSRDPQCVVCWAIDAALASAAQRYLLRDFARAVMQAWPEGGIDGGELQDIALARGLLRPAEPPTDWDGCNFYEKTELIK